MMCIFCLQINALEMYNHYTAIDDRFNSTELLEFPEMLVKMGFFNCLMIEVLK